MNDTKLILEALLLLLERDHELHDVTERIQSRLTEGFHEDRKGRKKWQPQDSVGMFSEIEALKFCNKRTAKGFTADALSNIGIEWPPPTRWKRRLAGALAAKFCFKRGPLGYELKSSPRIPLTNPPEEST